MTDGSRAQPQSDAQVTDRGLDAANSSAERATAAVKAIGVNATRANLARVAELDAAMGAIGDRRLDENQREAARMAAHRMIGSAGTFGFPRASELSRHLERFFSHASRHDAVRVRQAQQWLQALHQDFAAGPQHDDDEP